MILEVNNLKKYFPIKRKKHFVKAVDDVSFKIEKGDTFGLVGESGCGKTTTARTIIRLYEPTEGEMIFKGTDLAKLSKKEMRKERKEIQMVFQDPYASLHPRLTVEEIIKDPLKIYNIGTKKEQKERVHELLEVVGLDKRYALRYPHEFSGGQRQRIGIARALALNPELVLLDEAVSALDVSVQAQIINLLNKLQKEFDLTYLFIAHDLSVVEYMCDRLGVMYLGKLVEVGNKEKIFKTPQHPYTKALLSAIPSVKNIDKEKKKRILLKKDIPSAANPPSGCLFHTRCNYAMDVCRKTFPPKTEVSEDHIVYCHLLNK